MSTDTAQGAGHAAEIGKRLFAEGQETARLSRLGDVGVLAVHHENDGPGAGLHLGVDCAGAHRPQNLAALLVTGDAGLVLVLAQGKVRD